MFYFRIHRRVFRLGVKVYAFGIIVKIPPMKYHRAIGRRYRPFHPTVNPK